MITYDEMEKSLHYWGHRLATLYPSFQPEELENTAFMSVRKLDNPKYASTRIKWDMLSYIRNNLKKTEREHLHYTQLRSYQSVEQMSDVESLVRITSGQRSDLCDKRFGEIENRELVDVLVKRSHLTGREKRILFLRFYRNLTMRRIGEILQLSEGYVSNVLSSILKRLSIAAQNLEISL